MMKRRDVKIEAYLSRNKKKEYYGNSSMQVGIGGKENVKIVSFKINKLCSV